MTERTRGRHDGDEAIDWRTTDGGVCVYDPENPEAYVEMEFEAGVAPERRLFAICPSCGFAAPQRVPPGTRMICGECDAEMSCE